MFPIYFLTIMLYTVFVMIYSGIRFPQVSWTIFDYIVTVLYFVGWIGVFVFMIYEAMKGMTP
jgi:hypothetical protein